MSTIRALTPCAAINLLAFFVALGPLHAQQPAVSVRSRFQPSQALPQTVVAPRPLSEKLAATNRAAISVTAGDFFEDGATALVTGYSLGAAGALSVQQGSTLPRQEEFGKVFPFKIDTHFIEIGLRPDLLQSADLNRDGHQDLIVASRGGRSIQVLFGDGKGNFKPQPVIEVNGSVTAIAAWHSASGERQIAAAVCGLTCSIQIFRGDGSPLIAIPFGEKVSVLQASRINGTSTEDLIAGGSSRLGVIDGRSVSAGAPKVDLLPLVGAVAAASGVFVYDRRQYVQLAFLTSDGSIHTYARSGLIAVPPAPPPENVRPMRRQRLRVRPPYTELAKLPWVEVETLNAVAPPTGHTLPLLLRARFSGSGMDDLLALNANGGQPILVRHPVVLTAPASGSNSATVSLLPPIVESDPGALGEVAGAIPLRVSQDARFGLITASGLSHPEMGQQRASRTINVGSTADGSVTTSSVTACEVNSAGCTLRSALFLADEDSSENLTNGYADTINVPAGTFTLGQYAPDDGYGDARYHIEIYGPVNLVGAGASATIITTNNQDKIFSENSGNAPPTFSPDSPGDNNAQTPIDFYMSGITLQNGKNVNDYVNTQGNGDPRGGLMDVDTGGQGNITIVNSNFLSGTNIAGAGGGLGASDDYINDFNSSTTVQGGNGVLEIDSTVFQSNVAIEDGGAIYTANNVPILFNNDTFTGNSINPHLIDPCINNSSNTVNPCDYYGSGSGGAIYYSNLENLGCADSTCGPAPMHESLIENSTITGNSGVTNPYSTLTTSQSSGGGIAAYDGLNITNTVIQNNTISNEGGGVYLISQDYTPTLSGLTLTGNRSADGGGIWIFDCNGSNCSPSTVKSPSIQYSYIAGNTVTDTTRQTSSTSAPRTGLGVGEDGAGGENIDLSGYSNAPITATHNFWGCNGAATGTGCDTAFENNGGGTLALTPYAQVTASLNGSSFPTGSIITLTGGISQDSAGNALTNLNAFTGLSAVMQISQNTISVNATRLTTSSGTSSFSTTASTIPGPGTATFSIGNATITLNFTVTPSPASANSQSLSTSYETPLAVTLTASGTGPFTYNVLSNPAHGALGGAAPNLTYVPLNGFVGTDSFQFSATNAGGTGATATVSITVEKISPTIALSAPALADRGTAASLTATLNIPAGAPAPTAKAAFYSGSTLLGTQPMTQASPTTYVAVLQTASLPPGPQTLTASFPGDRSYEAATSPGQSTAVIANFVWIGNRNGTVSVFDPIGVPYLSSALSSGGGGGIAVDGGGSVWNVFGPHQQLVEFSHAGSPLTSTVALSTAAGMAIDASNRVWITDSSGVLSVTDSSGSALPGSPYSSPGSPAAISIDISGNLWIADSSAGVTEVLGAATPTIPLALGVSTNAPASKP